MRVGKTEKCGNSQRSPVHHHHIHHHHHHPPHPNQNSIIAREVWSTLPIWSKSRSCSDRYTWWRGLEWTIIVLKWHLHRCHHPPPHHHHHHHQKPEKVDLIQPRTLDGKALNGRLFCGIYLHHYHHPLIPILIPEPDQILPTWERWKNKENLHLCHHPHLSLDLLCPRDLSCQTRDRSFQTRDRSCQTRPTEGWTNFEYLDYHHPHLCPKTWPILSN